MNQQTQPVDDQEADINMLHYAQLVQVTNLIESDSDNFESIMKQTRIYKQLFYLKDCLKQNRRQIDDLVKRQDNVEKSFYKLIQKLNSISYQQTCIFRDINEYMKIK